MGMYSEPIADFIARLDYHTADVEGRILRGVSWEPIPVASVDGLKDLPAIRQYIPDISEVFRPTRHAHGSLILKLIVANKRDEGMVELAKLVEKVMDALEIDTTTQLYRALSGTTKPFSWRMDSSFLLDLSLNAQVSITAEPQVGTLTRRRL